MEKIYVEEQQQQRQQQRTKKLNSLNISLGLTFAVAFIAIASILFVSLSGTSFALDPVTTLPEEITTNTPTTADMIVPNNSSSAHSVTVYKATDNSGNTYQVYCLESNIDFVNATKLTRDEVISDKGLMYLSAKLENMSVGVNDFSGITLTEDQASKIKTWIVQNAIWSYLGIINPSDPLNAEEFNGGDGGAGYAAARQTIYLTTGPGVSPVVNYPDGNTTPLFTKYGVVDMISQAVTYHKMKEDPLTLTINKTGKDFTLVDNDKAYRSPKLTVSASSNLEGLAEVQDNYSLSLQGAPDGSYIQGIDKNGTVKKLSASELENLKLSEYKEFYVVVPKDKITEKNKKFTVEVEGNFAVYTGWYYRGTDADSGEPAQTVTTLKQVSYSNPSGVDLEVVYTPPVPNTAINASQTVYLIGLIVLLSGLGILYVNVKKQQKQN